MSKQQSQPLGKADFLAFVHSGPKLGLAIVVLILCIAAGGIIGTLTHSSAGGIAAGILLIIGGVLSIVVSVKFLRWERARPR